MKTTTKLILSALLLFGAAVSTSSCKRIPALGYMTVKMTDAPADYQKVNVEIIGIEVNVEGSGWISLPVKAGVYDLLELSNNVTVVIADNVKLPAGRLHQLRLELGSNNTLVTAAGTFKMDVPSGEESGLKINVEEDVQVNTHFEIVVDFDAAASVVEKGTGGFSLKPVLKVRSFAKV